MAEDIQQTIDSSNEKIEIGPPPKLKNTIQADLIKRFFGKEDPSNEEVKKWIEKYSDAIRMHNQIFEESNPDLKKDQREMYDALILELEEEIYKNGKIFE